MRTQHSPRSELHKAGAICRISRPAEPSGSTRRHPTVYQVSRSIYRELAPDILNDPIAPVSGSNHERVLRAIESAIYRLATDRHYFARPSRTLFREIRIYFPIAAQDHVYRVVDRYMTFAREWFEAQTTGGYDLAGNRLECRATTRKGTPCQRTPLAHNGYCPSHQHLADEGTFAVDAPGVQVAA